MLLQVDLDGISMMLMEAIIDFCRDESKAISKQDAYMVTQSGQQQMHNMTCGWYLLVRWKDQTKSWIKLANLKESHPVEVAKFAKAQGIANELAFAWWVPTMQNGNMLWDNALWSRCTMLVLLLRF